MLSAEVLLIDKPKGITSFDVIRRLRKTMGVKKMGHAGTLDPLATGLMIIGVGAGTKQLHHYIKLDKEYVATILFGEARSTGDMEGEVVAETVVSEPLAALEKKLKATLNAMQGELVLPVSAYSAIKVAGVPMYKRARKAEKTGQVVTELPMRKMMIKKADLLHVCQIGPRVSAEVRFFVGSGTYIRSLAVELGRQLGYPATLADLRRTKVGDFSIEDAAALSA